jgi:hypothetical protein
MDVKMKDWSIIAKAAEAVGARSLGQGLYMGQAGFGVHLKDWLHPLVIDKEGMAAYDNYGGRWGNENELKRLQEAYALAAAEKVCTEQGWYCQREADRLYIYHPQGGVISVEKGGTIEASNFVGAACAQATAELEKALGVENERTLKQEYGQVQLNEEVQD